MSLTVVVPSHQTRELVLRCLASLEAPDSGQIADRLVVDDGSTDGTAEAVSSRFPTVRVLRHERAMGFTAAANRGVDATRDELVLLLNSDTEVLAGSLDALIATFRGHPELGVAGARLLYPDGSPQWSHGREPGVLWCFALASGLGPWLGRRAWWQRVRGNARPATPAVGAYRRVGWVTGAALAFRREVWDAVGPLHEGFRFYGQDLDFCLRAKDAGWEVGLVEACVILHHHGATIGEVAPGGLVSRQNPALLWPDLVHWAGRRGGARHARWTTWSLTVGARLRLAARQLTATLRPKVRTESWQRDDAALARGVTALGSSSD